MVREPGSCEHSNSHATCGPPDQAVRVGVDDRVRANVRIQVGIATPEPDRITAYVASDAWIVAPEVVVVFSSFLVEVLPREPQIQREGFSVSVRIFVRFGIAERIGDPCPYDGPVGLRYRPRRAQVIRVNADSTFRSN